MTIPENGSGLMRTLASDQNHHPVHSLHLEICGGVVS